MWHTFAIRFLRRRIVLSLIFLLSLAYFLFQLLGPFKLEGDSEFVVKREHPLIWKNSDDNFSLPTKNDAKLICRNSVQGRFLLVDDRGFVCPRSDVLPTGCCNIENTSETKYLACDTCNEQDCCTIYEYCVSCCLHPDKKSLLEQVMEKATRRQMTVFASVRDNFELCLAKCRTDSHSVKHENKYRDPKARYCYGKTDPHDSAQKDGDSSVL